MFSAAAIKFDAIKKKSAEHDASLRTFAGILLRPISLCKYRNKHTILSSAGNGKVF